MRRIPLGLLFRFALIGLIGAPAALVARAQEGGEKPAATDDKSGKGKGDAGYGAYTDLQGRDEEYWTTAMDSARSRVQALEAEVSRVDSDEAALKNQFYARDDPWQREKDKEAWDETLNRSATMKAELEKAQKELSDLQAEARRSGALPGWLRESKDQKRKREELEARDVQKAPTFQVDREKLAEENKKADEKLFGKKEGEEDAAAGDKGEKGEKGEKASEKPAKGDEADKDGSRDKSSDEKSKDEKPGEGSS